MGFRFPGNEPNLGNPVGGVMALVVDVFVFLQEFRKFDVILQFLLFHLMNLLDVGLEGLQIIYYRFLIFHKFGDALVHLKQLDVADGIGCPRKRQLDKVKLDHMGCCHCL